MALSNEVEVDNSMLVLSQAIKHAPDDIVRQLVSKLSFYGVMYYPMSGDFSETYEAEVVVYLSSRGNIRLDQPKGKRDKKMLTLRSTGSSISRAVSIILDGVDSEISATSFISMAVDRKKVMHDLSEAILQIAREVPHGH